jgi:CRP-like cAMP-binding protein
MVRKLSEHSSLMPEDLTEISMLSVTMLRLIPDQDVVRQGDRPTSSALVIEGMVARYHLLPDGRRQYLSFHIAGDLPDTQALFVDEMDHAVCAIGPACVGMIPHKELVAAFDRRPLLGAAVWRETLIDAAIFREAITNNSARSPIARMAHLFCELVYRSKAAGLTTDTTCYAPIGLRQLGETLGLSLATVNRALAQLRQTRICDFQGGNIEVHDWRKLSELGHFQPTYLHLKKPMK